MPQPTWVRKDEDVIRPTIVYSVKITPASVEQSGSALVTGDFPSTSDILFDKYPAWTQLPVGTLSGRFGSRDTNESDLSSHTW